MCQSPQGGNTILQEDICRDCALKKCGNIFRILRCFLLVPGNYAVVLYRFGHWLHTRPGLVQRLLWFLYVLLERRLRREWGIRISAKATIDPGFRVIHYGGIFIDDAAVIGKKFTITHNVVIGLRGKAEKRGVPHIGDNVFMSPEAIASGSIRIGNNAHIGPNAVVNRDIPDDALVHPFPIQVVVFPGRYKPSNT